MGTEGKEERGKGGKEAQRRCTSGMIFTARVQRPDGKVAPETKKEKKEPTVRPGTL